MRFSVLSRYSGDIHVFQRVIFRLLNQIILLAGLWAIANGNQEDWHDGYWILGAICGVVFEFLAEYFALYDLWTLSIFKRLKHIIYAWGGSSMIILFIGNILILGARELPLLLSVWVILSLILMSILNLFQSVVFNLFRKRPKCWQKVAIVGASPLGRQLHNTFSKMPWLGYELIGYYDDRRRDAIEGQNIIGGINDVYRDTINHLIDVVYIALPSKAEHRYQQLLENLKETKVEVIIVPDLVVLDLLYYNKVRKPYEIHNRDLCLDG